MQLVNNRRRVRIPTKKAAIITKGTTKIACVIRDLTEDGAGLSVTATKDVPEHFILTVQGEEEGRACTVRWREPTKLGVSFD
jgi:hypothetical protein